MLRAPLLATLLTGLLLLAGCNSPADKDPDGGGGPSQTTPAPWTWSDGPGGIAHITGSPVPFGLAEFALAPEAGSVTYLVGGFTDAGGGSPLVIQMTAGSSTPGGFIIPLYPLAVHHAQAAVVGDFLYVFGGYVGGALLPGTFVPGAGPPGWPQTPLAFRLDLRAGSFLTWQPIAPLPELRSAGGAAVVDGHIYLVGGHGLDGFPTTVQRYDPATDTYAQVADLPTPRDHLNVLEHGGLVYAVAGRIEAGGVWDDLEAFEVYDPNADQWSDLPSIPLGRGGQAAAFLDDQLVVVGGERAEGSTTVYDNASLYDVVNRTWGELPPMPEARHGGGLRAFDGKLYYYGGARLDGTLAANTLQLSPPQDSRVVR